VELQNVVGILIDQPLEQESWILVVQNVFRGMELGSQLGLHSQYICPSIETNNRELEGYSHPHIAP
jgi:hypothetical protein